MLIVEFGCQLGC